MTQATPRWSPSQRRPSRTIHVGTVAVGGGTPVSIQSMTTTDTGDAEATLAQIRDLMAEGCEIIRVAVPEQVAAGALFTVRTIINHPMETGLRRDKSGLLVPVRIADRFTCRANGEVVFGAKLEPAIAANPYIAFSLRLEESADLAFEWVDSTGERYESAARVEVV